MSKESKKNKTFILHDESVNTRGFRMLTSGVNLTEFKKNPVMLLNHSDYSLPIGRWDNIRIEGGKILADAVFDEQDPRALEVKSKVDGDFIRAASIGAWPPEEVSDAYNLRIPGQIGITVTKWTVREASIVPIGANHNALAFYDRISKEPIDLDAPGALLKLIDSNKLNNRKSMGQLTQILNLNDAASEEKITESVQVILKDNTRLKSENETLTKAIDDSKAKEKESLKKQSIELVDAAIKDGRMDSNGRESILKLFDQDFSSAKQMLESMSMRKSVVGQIQTGQTGTISLGDLSSKSWDEIDKMGRLTLLKDNDPSLYSKKFEERFGIEPKL